MLAIVEKFGVGQAILGGQSMGCATALCAAVRAPEQAKGLVLVSPPTAWETRALQADGYDKFANMLESMGKETLIRFMRQMSFFPAWMLKEIPELNELYVDEVAKMNESSLVPILRGAKLCVFPERNLLKSLAMPTLILAWTDDPIHPVSTAEELHHLLPNSRLVVSRTMQELRGLTGLIGDYFG
jgi:pimeloyl-ACP methyl ester carboxylesterase